MENKEFMKQKAEDMTIDELKCALKIKLKEISMNVVELKTLKGLKFINNPNPICKAIKHELRQEASKLIKAIRNTKVYIEPYDKEAEELNEKEKKAQESIIQYFFNITEKDLK